MKTIEKCILYIKVNIKKIAACLLVICMAMAALLLVKPGRLFAEDGGRGKTRVKTEPDKKAANASNSNDAYATFNMKMHKMKMQKLSCKYYIENDFKRSIGSVLAYDTGKTQIKGGIVPHHLLADSLIAPFFKSLSVEEPDTVFLIGPNHKRIGQKQIHTGSWDWQTPFGVLQADDDAICRILEECEGEEDFELLEDDHSVSALIPYIKYYMPQARIVPLLLHGNLGIEKSKRLAEQIYKEAGDKKIIIIGSVDFSHYLPPDKADIMDGITLKAIKKKDFDVINQMGNDNLDCPPAIITVLEAMDIAGAKEMKVTAHSNSARIAGAHNDSTTSYFTILFLKGE